MELMAIIATLRKDIVERREAVARGAGLVCSAKEIAGSACRGAEKFLAAKDEKPDALRIRLPS